jgi:hypothetical protein
MPPEPGPLTTGRRRKLAILVPAGAVVLLAAAAGLWLALSGTDQAEGPGSAEPGASPAAPTYGLAVDLGRVGGYPVAGDIPDRRLQKEGQAVRDTMTGLYTAGFVDPALWEEGRFPTVPDFFAGQARRQVPEDLQDLTLGRAAASLSAVRPEHARVLVRFLLDAHRRPVAATADMEFEGTALAEGIEVPVRHEGRYVLRPTGDRWLIVAYEVQGRLGTGEAR